MLITRTAIGVAACGFLLAGVQTYRLDRAMANRATERLELAACGARLANIIEDLESDNAIDRLPDDALRAVPDHWLQPEGG